MKKILIVDDNPQFSKLLKTRLQMQGYKVIIAVDGKDGLEEIRESKPDLIVLDILMPRVDGYTFLKKVKAADATKDIPVFIVTAKDDMSSLFIKEGAAAYFVKPFDTEELLQKIKEVLYGKKHG